MPHYPHMLAEDTEVWSRYLQDPAVPVLEVWYDVHVGQGVLLPVGSDNLIERIARGVTRKRIDVVCRVESSLWVVEIKPFGSMLALGQALAYRGMFVREYVTAYPIFPVVVCDQIDDDLVLDFESCGVGLIVNG